MKRLMVGLVASAILMGAIPASAADAPKAKDPAVEVFVTSWCPYCKKLEEHLRTEKIDYRRYDIESDPDGARIFGSIGGSGVPVTRVYGKYLIPGYDPESIQEALKSRA